VAAGAARPRCPHSRPPKCSSFIQTKPSYRLHLLSIISICITRSTLCCRLFHSPKRCSSPCRTQPLPGPAYDSVTYLTPSAAALEMACSQKFWVGTLPRELRCLRTRYGLMMLATMRAKEKISKAILKIGLIYLAMVVSATYLTGSTATGYRCWLIFVVCTPTAPTCIPSLQTSLLLCR
jgi:hypothetical protein